MTEITQKTEQKIIDYLHENGPSFLGEVLKELKLSYTNGTKHVQYLLTKGVVKHSDPPLQFELNTETK